MQFTFSFKGYLIPIYNLRVFIFTYICIYLHWQEALCTNPPSICFSAVWGAQPGCVGCPGETWSILTFKAYRFTTVGLGSQTLPRGPLVQPCGAVLTLLHGSQFLRWCRWHNALAVNLRVKWNSVGLKPKLRGVDSWLWAFGMCSILLSAVVGWWVSR